MYSALCEVHVTVYSALFEVHVTVYSALWEVHITVYSASCEVEWGLMPCSAWHTGIKEGQQSAACTVAQKDQADFRNVTISRTWDRAKFVWFCAKCVFTSVYYLMANFYLFHTHCLEEFFFRVLSCTNISYIKHCQKTNILEVREQGAGSFIWVIFRKLSDERVVICSRFPIKIPRGFLPSSFLHSMALDLI